MPHWLKATVVRLRKDAGVKDQIQEETILSEHLFCPRHDII